MQIFGGSQTPPLGTALCDANTEQSTASRAESVAHAAACNASGDLLWTSEGGGRPKRPDERKEEMWEDWTAALASEEEMETEDGTMNFGTGR